MTRKQIKKLANQIAKLELTHRDPDLSKEEKARVEKQITSLASMIALLPNGLDVMSEVDEQVQRILKENDSNGSSSGKE